MGHNYTCGHAGKDAGPFARLMVQSEDHINPGLSQVLVCRQCVLSLTGYPEELTRTLDRAIVEKRFGGLKVTFQNGVPGVVYFDDALKVESWQPWPRKNWIVEKGET